MPPPTIAMDLPRTRRKGGLCNLFFLTALGPQLPPVNRREGPCAIFRNGAAALEATDAEYFFFEMYLKSNCISSENKTWFLKLSCYKKQLNSLVCIYERQKNIFWSQQTGLREKRVGLL